MLSRDYLNLIDQQLKKDKMDKDLLDEQIKPSIPWDLNDMKQALLCDTLESFEAHFGILYLYF